MENRIIVKSFVTKVTWLYRCDLFDFGWGNGYVIIPSKFKLDIKAKGDIYNLIPDLTTHKGITFSGRVKDFRWWHVDVSNKKRRTLKKDKNAWVIGFDTCHGGDCLENCSKEYVLHTTRQLQSQIVKYLKKFKK